MSQERDQNIALFIDFDNVALGARDARQRFDIKLLLQRVLEKGKVIVKKAYADWHYYKEHMSPLHEAAIELIEIPMPRISGKNSADIKLVVDAMDLCYSKDHIDTFVIVSGDSDFSPLVSKLRENNKRVIGIGVKNSSSHLLINNCDEFMFYDDIYRNAMGQTPRSVGNVPSDKRDLFDFLLSTVQGLLQESRGVLYSSLIKDTMTRKQPDFNERNFGFSNFGDLLDEARSLGLLLVERDARAGGTWVVQGIGEGSAPEKEKGNDEPGSGSSRSSRRRRSRRSRGDQDERRAKDQGEGKEAAGSQVAREGQKGDRGAKTGPVPEPVNETAPAASGEKTPDGKAATRKPVTKKAVTKKATTKKATTKKTTTKKASPTKKAPTKKAATKKPATTKKTTTKKATPAKKAPTKKTVTKKPTTKKTTTKKTGNRNQ